MPLIIMKKVWDYCTYNKPFFIFILALFIVMTYISDYCGDSENWVSLILVVVNVIILGYGMTITRDRIYNHAKLPKLMVKDIISYGIKGTIVFVTYICVQGFILDLICSPLNFPAFELEEMLLKLPQTINLLFTSSPGNALIFLVVGSALFYITSFFMEIAIARLADTGSLLSAFNVLGIKNDIDTYGWVSYAKDLTFIVIAIVLFTSLNYIVFPITIINYIWSTVLIFFTFVTQFLGIGAVYSEIKIMKSNQTSYA